MVQELPLTTVEELRRQFIDIQWQDHPDLSEQQIRTFYTYRKPISKEWMPLIPQAEIFYVRALLRCHNFPQDLLLNLLSKKEYTDEVLRNHHLPSLALHQYLKKISRKLFAPAPLDSYLAFAFLKQPHLSKEDFLLIFDKHLPISKFFETIEPEYVDTNFDLLISFPSPALPDALLIYLKNTADSWSPTNNNENNNRLELWRQEQLQKEGRAIVEALLKERPLTAIQLLHMSALLPAYGLDSTSTQKQINLLLFKTPEARSIIEQLKLQFITLSDKEPSVQLLNKIVSSIKKSTPESIELPQ